MITSQSIENVRMQADIRRIVGEFAELNGSGSRITCCCPLHNEKTPSFHINTATNTWHCFGCGEGGDAISFIHKKLGYTFPEAVKYIADKHHISIQEEQAERTPEQQQQDRQREAMLIAYEHVQKFFVENLHHTDEEAVFAYQYACSRWGQDFVDENGIGFAYNKWSDLINFAQTHSLSTELLTQMGLLKQKEDGRSYDFFRGRIMIPIRDNYGRIIGYTARTLSSDPNAPKYLNTSTNLLYQKDRSVFGLDTALKTAAKADKLYLVEGAPDVLRLQSIGVLNAVASLGADWTDHQLEILRRYTLNLCFLPDADTPKYTEAFGTGIKKVMKSGAHALELGFHVSVKEIPLGEGSQKNDPDSYCKNITFFNDLDEEDFILWYAHLRVKQCGDAEPGVQVIEDIARLVGYCDKEHERNMYIDKLTQVTSHRGTWNKAVKAALQNRERDKICKSATPDNQQLLEKYGFQIIDNRYVSLGMDGKMSYWSNFVLRPLFHIRDTQNAIRLYEMTNYLGQKEIIELKQEDLGSLQKFSQKIESYGNFIWSSNLAKLQQLKSYLYENTDTAFKIDQLGWQPAGFYAFGNGAYLHSQWYPVDENGISHLPQVGNQYLPAFSKIYQPDTQLYQFERRFVHNNWSSISLRDYCDLLINVFGDNAKVGIAFVLASLFHDVVVAQTKSFPILNIFGPKGSGKSELGHSLMSFFIIENSPLNIMNSTLPALADAVAQAANAVVHLDEYKNTIDLDKREFLKGLWDCVGRNRKNMDKDKKREVSRVDSGVIVTGQEMATVDIAIFSRFIFLSFPKSEFSQEAKQRFQQLLDARKMGCSHLTLEILSHRQQFDSSFRENYDRAFEDLRDALQNAPIEDRILRNWVTPLAAMRTLSSVLDLPFTYNDLLSISIQGVRNQNHQTKSNNELATYWDTINFLRNDGQLSPEGDFRISMESELKCKDRDKWHFPSGKQVLAIKIKQSMELYIMQGRRTGDAVLPKNSLAYYLENSPAYLGKKVVRFKDIVHGIQQMETITEANGTTHTVAKSHTELAYCFDYSQLVEAYDINLLSGDAEEDEKKTEASEPKPAPAPVHTPDTNPILF